jgi:cobyrinic acid a,c-diamide synthase
MGARLVIGGAASGVGKTTVTVALAQALREKGLRVVLFKCGPDYLDPTYHVRASGLPSHNLDGWMMGRDAVLATFARAAAGADVALIEGVMGLYDGASVRAEAGSTAEIAKWLAAPVVLVVDASGMARTLAAVVAGFVAFDPEVRIAGVVANRVGSREHLELLRRALDEPQVLGGLPEDPGLRFPERHLGLLSASETAVPQERFAAWGRRALEWLDLDRIVAIARAAPALPSVEARTVAEGPPRSEVCRIAVAWDEAFHFYYEDNLARLERLGARLVRFSPIRDRSVPPADALYLGGGYPEVHARELSENRSMRASIGEFAAQGGVVYAECGGLMYLSRAIRTLDGTSFAMVGLVPGEVAMGERLRAIGYVEVETQAESILGPAGLRFRGHEFRYSELRLDQPVERVYSVRRRRGDRTFPEGYRVGPVLASYVHAHWASNPRVAEGLVAAAAARARRRRS